MHRLTRYVLSTLVALAVLAVVGSVSDGDDVAVLLACPVVYGVSMSLVVAHRDTWLRINRGDSGGTSAKMGAISGGIGALGFTSLLQVSVPVGVTGFGLLVFGSAVAYTDFAGSGMARDESAAE